MPRSARACNRDYFHQAYQTGEHGWEVGKPSPYVRKHLEMLSRVAPGGRLLDLGCGEGRHCLLAARLGFRPTGLDLEPLAITRARAQAQAAGLADSVTWVVGDVLKLPAFPAPFDLVLDYGCLHHQRKADHGRYLQSLRAALRPGGHLLLSVFSTHFLVYGPQERRWHLAHGAYRRFFTADDLHRLFDRDFEFVRLEEEREGRRGFWHGVLRMREG